MTRRSLISSLGCFIAGLCLDLQVRIAPVAAPVMPASRLTQALLDDIYRQLIADGAQPSTFHGYERANA